MLFVYRHDSSFALERRRFSGVQQRSSIMRQRGEFRPEWILESDHGTDRVERGCANDSIALGALNGFMECGLRVPDDISIVAHDGSYPTQHSVLPLTTVDVHSYQLGAEAVRMLSSALIKPPPRWLASSFCIPR